MKRAAVHYGHSIDYVTRLIVWRHLVHHDLNITEWSPIILAILDRHGRLGNDGEVCWALYAAIRLGVPIPQTIAETILNNCSPLSMIALLSCVEPGLVLPAIFTSAAQTIASETGAGSHWPLLLEWKSRQWSGYENLNLDNDLIVDLAQNNTTLFELSRLTMVFQDFNEDEFGSVEFAIEDQPSQYDDGDDNEEEMFVSDDEE